jgi:hypothetical protein
MYVCMWVYVYMYSICSFKFFTVHCIIYLILHSEYFYLKHDRSCGLQISANMISTAKIKYLLHLGYQRTLYIKGFIIPTRKLAVGVKG